MYTIQFLPHTADIRLNIRADSLEELFIAGLQGMNNLMKKGFCIKNKEYPLQKTVQIESQDTTNLLIDFLSDILTLSHINKVVYCRLKFVQFKTNKLKAVLYGNTIDQFDEDIKAVTYHEVNVCMNKNQQWETSILFDI